MSTTAQRKKRLRIQLVAAGCILAAGLVLLYHGGHVETESAPTHAARLSAESQIRIAYGDPKTFFMPPYAPKDAQLADVEMEATDAASASIALEAIERSLQQYPKGFVAKLIGAIFIAGEMRIGGARAGGTPGPAWIVLAAPARLGREGIFATNLIGVHHELSSFVLRRRPAAWQRWAAFTPAGWRYKRDAQGMLSMASVRDPSPETGFLSAYGSSDAENDFNVYAEKIFTEPEAVARLARTHELIQKKLDFVMAEYVAVDVRMEGVFRALGLYRRP
jgi:hypothetical protein